VLPSGQKLTLGLLATLDVAHFRVYASFPELLPIFKCVLEVVFCESIQHRLRFCLDHLSCVKMATFQFYFQSGKQRKVEWVGSDGHVLFGQNFLGEKGNVRQCVAVMKHVKDLGEVFTHVHAVGVKCHISMLNSLFGLLGRILCKQSP
jgi:hypothetical protein